MAERLRRLLRRGRRRPAPPAPAPAPLVEDWSVRDVKPVRQAAGPVTTRLTERLRPEDLAAIEAGLVGDPASAELWRTASAEGRRLLLLCGGVSARMPAVLERTGLVPDEPPEEVHAMARGWLAAGGDYSSADLVVEGLEIAGGDMARVRRALDFGCSSGRTVRALAAAYPDVEWHGTDPNAASIAWAAEHLPMARFSRNNTVPPLEVPDAHFDLVYAISIWSHFGERAAERWLDEMRRVTAPGGHLVLTVHGPQSVAHYGTRCERPPEQLDEIVKALHRRGFWYAAEFGEAGDFGVVHPEWGTAFMSPEWLLRTVTPAWHVTWYAPGRNAGNQDLVVLLRSP